MENLVVVVSFLGFILFIVVPSAVRIVQEYERGVVFRLGRLVEPRGPGLILLIPFVERMRKVDLRTITLEVPTQEAITRDNVTVKVSAVVYFRVITPSDAVVKVLDHVRATSQISQTTLRSVLGESDLDELLSQREALNQRLQKIVDEQTEPWGVKVSVVEIKDVELPQSMQRAMARQAEAERERRAKVIHADGEAQAAERLSEAGRVLSGYPAALTLRFLQALTEMATERTSTVVFPLPIDLVRPFLEAATRPAGGNTGSAGPPVQ